jgi:hypothetical protein
MKILVSAITAAVVLCGGPFPAAHAQSQSHVIQTPKEAQWGLRRR